MRKQGNASWTRFASFSGAMRSAARLRLGGAVMVLFMTVGIASALADVSAEPDYGTPTPEAVAEAIAADSQLTPTLPTDSVAAQELPHEDLGRDEALELLTGVFDAQLQNPAGVFDDLSVEKFLSAHVAVVASDPLASSASEGPAEGESEPDSTSAEEKGEHAESALLDSLVPLGTQTPSGNLQPVDLSLEHKDGELRPANPLTDVGIPKELGDGIRFPGTGVTVALAAAPEERAASIVDQSVAFLPNVAADTDLAIAPTPSGVETLTHLRSPDAPRSQTFEFQFPAGASLQATEGGGAAIKRDEETLLTISPPTAIDANGEDVPVTLEVDQNSVTLAVSADSSAAYPILVDPLFQTYQWANIKFVQSGICNSSIEYIANNNCTNREEWGYEHIEKAGVPFRIQLANHDGEKTGLYITTENTLTTGDHGSMIYTVPRYFTDQASYGVRPTSYLSHMTLSNLTWNAYSTHLSPYLFTGIWDPVNANWVSYYTHEGLIGHGVNDPSFQYQFSNSGNTNAKVGYVSIQATETQPSSTTNVFVGSATMELADTGVPSAGPVEGPSKWVDQTAAPITFTTADSGLGVYSLTASDEWPVTPHAWKTSGGCLGVGDAACPRYWKSSDSGRPPLKYEPGVLPQGVNFLKVVAEDPVGNKSAPAFAEVRVDHTTPQLGLSGTLTEQAKLGTISPEYKLNYSASDGDSASPAAITPFGSAGTAEGKTQRPTGIAVDAAGNVFVVDRDNNRVEKFDSTGKFLMQFGSAGSANGQFNEPRGIAIAPSGDLWVADSGNARVQRFNSSGVFISKFGTKGTGGGSQFVQPYGIAIVKSAPQVGGVPVVYVSDAGGNRVAGFFENGSFIGNVVGTASNPSAPASFGEPSGIAVDASNNLWVADAQNNRVQKFNAEGKFAFQFGTGGTGNGQFNGPIAVAATPAGNVLVVDGANHRIQEFRPYGAYMRTFGSIGSANSQLSEPRGVTIGPGNIAYVADAGNHRIAKWSHADFDPQSGVASTEVKVDGSLVEPKYAPGCSTQNCTISREWTLKAKNYATGSHTLEVRATDGVGLPTVKTLTISTVKDVTAPQLTTSKAFFGAPEGWLEQKSYVYSATAKDPGGYGATSLVLKIDGKVIASSSQACPNGGCEKAISGVLDMSTYKGGAYAAEVIATDGAGLMTKKAWTINVDPDGIIAVPEAEDTLEAVEDTSVANLIGAPKPEEEQEGTGFGLGVKVVNGEIEATGTEVPTLIGSEPSEGFNVVVLDTSVLGDACPGSAPEPETAPQTELSCEAGPPESAADADYHDEISVTPVTTSASSSENIPAGGTATVATNTGNHVDSIIRPLYEGLLTFKTIRDNSAPETFSWQVDLNPGQELKLEDSKHAEVYYEDGHPAFAITAEPAHDAVGTEVATSLSVSGDTVTLTVSHRAAAYVYPVLGGAGWQGGFVTTLIEGPQDEQEIKEEEERIEREERERREAEESGEEIEGNGYIAGMELVVRGSAIGPPVPSNSTATASQKTGTPKHIFKFSECRYYLEEGDVPEVPMPPRRPIVEIIGSCLRAGNTDKIKYGMTVRGWFHYITGQWVWVNESPADQLECVKWGANNRKPAMVHCFARPYKAKVGITVRGDYRAPPELGSSVCHTIYGTLQSSIPYKEPHESILSLAHTAGDEPPDPCDWPG